MEPIIKAMAVPSGTPLSTSDSITGSIVTASMYRGMAIKTASGTEKMLSEATVSLKNDSGTKPWMNEPTVKPKNTYGTRFFIVAEASL